MQIGDTVQSNLSFRSVVLNGMTLIELSGEGEAEIEKMRHKSGSDKRMEKKEWIWVV